MTYVSPDTFALILDDTDRHRARHNCWAYPFRDGPALGVLAAATGALRVLELGTALGYTACWLATGAPEARIDTIERDPLHAALARENFEKLGLGSRVTLLEGDFGAVIPTLAPGYDLAFIDGYAPSLEQVRQVRTLMRRRGVLITANLDLEDDQKLRAELMRSDRWLTAPLLETGRTMVSVAL